MFLSVCGKGKLPKFVVLGKSFTFACLKKQAKLFMNKKIRQFLIILFSISFISAGLFYVLGGMYQSLTVTAFASLYMLFPMITVIIVQHVNGEPIFKEIGVSFKINRWWFVGWLLMPIFNLAALGVSALLPGISYTTENPILLQSIEQM